MDLTVYYQTIRTMAEAMTEAYPVVISLGTPDGGKDGVPTEVTRALAAKMIAERQARLATPEEAKAFREAQAEAKREAEKAAAAARVEFSVLTTAELNRLRGAASQDAE